MRFRHALLVIVIGYSVGLLGGCGGDSGIGRAEQVRQDPQVPSAGPGLAVPLPSDLILPDAPPRRTTYYESDVWKPGCDYDSLLPCQNVSANGQNLDYSPSWISPLASDAADLAYATWLFQIPGYDRNPQICYYWLAPLTDPAEGWIGLANWAKNQWDWFVSEADGALDLGSLLPYFDTSDRLAVIVLRTGTEQSTIGTVRVGSKLPLAKITATPSSGMVPLTVAFDGSESSAAQGEIVKFEWDWDGDGSYEYDSGTDPTVEHEYVSQMVGAAYLRVTDENGLHGSAPVEISAIDAWAHTWGGSAVDETNAIARNGQYLYCVGSSRSIVGDNLQSLVLLKYTITGELVWSRAFYGNQFDSGTDLVIDSEDNLIVVGVTESWGNGGKDILYQKWDHDGNLIWSHTWGGSAMEFSAGVSLGGDHIFIAGATSTYGAGSLDLVLIRANNDGSIDWALTWGGDTVDVPSDISGVPSISGSNSFRVTGSSTSYGAGGEDVLYLGFTEDGTISQAYTWGNSHDQFGTCVNMGIFGSDPYVCGYDTSSGDEKLLLLEFSGAGSFNRKVLNHSGEHRANDFLRFNDNFILAGRYRENAGTPFNGLFAVVDSTDWKVEWQAYMNPVAGAEFKSLRMFGGQQGLFLGGKMDDNVGTFYATFFNTMTDLPSIAWQSQVGMVTGAPIGYSATDNAIIDNAGGADIDTGGGEDDCALLLAPLD